MAEKKTQGGKSKAKGGSKSKSGTKKTSTRKASTAKKTTGRNRKAPARTAGAKAAASGAPVAESAEAAAGGGTHTEFELSNEEIEIALQTGDHAGLLEDYFGPEQYRELRELSREAASRSVRGAPRALILPGIMGSKIGKRRFGPFDDVIWIDPLDVARGELDRLTLTNGAGGLEALGVILLGYLKLKLRLRAAGYDAEFYPFDWRLSIADLGRQLIKRLKEEGEDRVNLVAHSMGGLVARWALANGGTCRRLVMLGTPNYGSFAPVMALRGAYPVVRKLAWLADTTAERLATDIFSSFPGLTQMLPNTERFRDVDLYDLAKWPADDLRPRKAVLDGVKAVHDKLGSGAENMYLIAGIEQETVTGLESRDGAFHYVVTHNGDGTVPLAFCALAGLDQRTYYIAEKHGSLPNNKVVARAVGDLLDRAETKALPDSYTPPERREGVKPVAEEKFRVDPYEGRRGSRLSQRELRSLIDEVVAPDAREDQAPPAVVETVAAAMAAAVQPGFQHEFEQVVVGRRRQHRIDLRFALGSITEIDTRALALGIFRDVAPSGAASALDKRLGGAITELSRRRMFSGNVGEIFIMPTGRHDLRADLVAFVGLGPFDRFNTEVLQTAAENVIRTFVNTRVEEFATVIFGGGSGGSVPDALRNLLTGFFRGLLDADSDHHFRRLVVCEYDKPRFTQLKEEIYRLSSTPLCRDVEITFDEQVLPEGRAVRALPRRLAQRADPVYLIVRQEGESDDRKAFHVRSSVLTAGAKATVVTGAKIVPVADFEALRRKVDDVPDDDFSAPGLELSSLFLAEEVKAVLPRQVEDHHLVVVHDAPLSRVPWETMALESASGEVQYPAAKNGLSHRYAADNLSVAKWLEERIEDDTLSVLLVVDPTRDLPGAVREGNRVGKMFEAMRGCHVDELRQDAATRPALLSAFSSGRYDVIHYAGHAFFDESTPERSGILCAGRVVLSGADLAGLGNLPSLVFFNACEAGRVRAAGAKTRKEDRLETRLVKAVGLAEAFMRGGVANFIGTYWPVGDAEADTFSVTFYEKVIRGTPIGEALQAGRTEVRDKHSSRDWADYILYGNPDFVLKAGDEE